jgi:hypothetical protein
LTISENDRLPLVVVGRGSRALFWVSIGWGVALAVYAVVRSPTPAGVAVAVVTLAFFGGLGFLGLHRIRRIRQPSYLELSQDGATLVAPGVLAEPFVIPLSGKEPRTQDRALRAVPPGGAPPSFWVDPVMPRRGP